MLTLYHNDMSVCAQKVRLCLAEKGLSYTDKHLNLRAGDQKHRDYLKLNPNGYVPTLVHDDFVVYESTVVCEYLDDAFPDPPLKPADARGAPACAGSPNSSMRRSFLRPESCRCRSPSITSTSRTSMT